MSTTLALLILAWIAIVLISLALGGIVAQLRDIHTIVAGRPIRKRTPVVGQLLNEDGEIIGVPYAVLFVSPGYPTCQNVVPIVTQFAAKNADNGVPVLMVSDQPYKIKDSDKGSVSWIIDDKAALEFGVPAFPWLVIVDIKGTVIDHDIAYEPDDVVSRLRNGLRKGVRV